MVDNTRTRFGAGIQRQAASNRSRSLEREPVVMMDREEGEGYGEDSFSPFDTVLAAASIASEGNYNTQQQQSNVSDQPPPYARAIRRDHYGPLVPPPPPTQRLPLKRVKTGNCNGNVGGGVVSKIANNNVCSVAPSIKPSSVIPPPPTPPPQSAPAPVSVNNKWHSHSFSNPTPVALTLRPGPAPLCQTHSRVCSVTSTDKGLRHFSVRVCAKVQEKGTTTYNEVADELVAEIGREQEKCDNKNIRRRVYDALNVLMAIDVIEKDKKEIRWLGLPDESISEMNQLESFINQTEERIKEKKKNISELVHRFVCLKNLITRNGGGEGEECDVVVEGVEADEAVNKKLKRQASDDDDVVEIYHNRTALSDSASAFFQTTIANHNYNTPQATASSLDPTDRLQLPFILINAPHECRVHCEMLEDRSQYFFEFDSPFLINEDIELLRLMGMDHVLEAELSRWLPPDLIAFLHRHSLGTFSPLPNVTVTETAPLVGDSIDSFAKWGTEIDNLLESMPPSTNQQWNNYNSNSTSYVHRGGLLSSPIRTSHHSKNTTIFHPRRL